MYFRRIAYSPLIYCVTIMHTVHIIYEAGWYWAMYAVPGEQGHVGHQK